MIIQTEGIGKFFAQIRETYILSDTISLIFLDVFFFAVTIMEKRIVRCKRSLFSDVFAISQNVLQLTNRD